LEAIEVRRQRQLASEAAQSLGLSLNHILDEAIRVLALPMDEQRVLLPGCTDAERRHMQTLRPWIWRARYGPPRP
jgi:hypothetical protein